MKKIYCLIALLLPFASFAQCPSGNVIISSQAELTDFANDFGGCTSLPESLHIFGQPGASDITDLSPLSFITSVGTSISIEGVEGLTSLNGLHNIVSVGGNIEIYYNPLLTDLTALSKITNVPDNILIYENAALTTLAGLQNIQSVGRDLDISDNPSLTTLSSLTLTSIGDDLSIDYNPLLTDLQGLQNVVTLADQLTVSNNDALTSIQALSGITVVNDDLEISYNPLLTSLAGLENITALGGDLAITDNASLTDLLPLSDITAIGGQLSIGANPLFTDLKGLQNIKSVESIYIYQSAALTTLSDLTLSSAGGVIIEDNDLLTDLQGLENITALENLLVISDNAGLTNLDELAALTQVGSLIIANNLALSNIQALSKLTTLTALQVILNSALTDLQGLQNVTTVAEQIIILQNPGLTSLRGLDGLISVDGELMELPGFIIFANPNLTNIRNLSAFTRTNSGLLIAENSSLLSLEGLNNLVSIGPYSTLWISGNPLLTSLAGIGKFENLNAVIIENNAALTDMSGLETLGSVTDTFSILGNNALTSLKGLNNLTAIGGELILDSNPLLENLKDLNGLTYIQQRLTITNNESLGTCAVAGICAFLTTSSPDVVAIYNNSTGCNSQEEVETDCASLPVTLVAFTAEKNENFVQVRWSTSSEVNSSHFEIQHSHDAGKSWDILGDVQAGRESFEERKYEFIHLNPSNGENLYRLKMIDLDKTFTFSTIRSVNLGKANGFSVYPNPVADQLTVETGNVASAGKLRVYNAAGKIILSKDVNFSGKPYQVETSTLPTGIYTIQVLNDLGVKEVHKFIKVGP
ncbi:T9SS type A sorting domain-containing protein [Dyadobacter sp. CY347]|uniref:T9SS type A sorting domain-containing protein n=1 Tax=Dyadobacter sp. CY347 TaxID=2909336 RepID=UPI001F2CFC0C|nr:T9SS type A sorting domain-containing protein [Dyadobacter sp. CY347]MCF2489237.1 T9SS type A sorting domain-containing protein [Dyadobacter sp. CY347]